MSVMSVGQNVQSTSDAVAILKRDGETINTYFSQLHSAVPMRHPN